MKSKNSHAQNANSYGSMQQPKKGNAASFTAGKRSLHNAIINPTLFSSFNDFSNADPLQNERALVAFHFRSLFPFQPLTEKRRPKFPFRPDCHLPKNSS